jgi:hypothetical protein
MSSPASIMGVQRRTVDGTHVKRDLQIDLLRSKRDLIPTLSISIAEAHQAIFHVLLLSVGHDNTRIRRYLVYQGGLGKISQKSVPLYICYIKPLYGVLLRICAPHLRYQRCAAPRNNTAPPGPTPAVAPLEPRPPPPARRK